MFADHGWGGAFALLPLILVLILCVLSVSSLLERYARAKEMHCFLQLVGLAIRFAEVIHALQKERAASSGFLASHGEGAKVRMRAQRRATDQTLSLINANMIDRLWLPWVSVLTLSLEESRDRLEALDTERALIDSGAVSATDASRWYEETIGTMLDMFPMAGILTREPELAASLNGYVNFLQAKERAGQERAAGAIGFGEQRFDIRQVRHIQKIDAEYDTFLRLASAQIGGERWAEIERGLNDTTIVEVDRLRRVAFDSLSTGDLQGVTADLWIKATTARIDLLHRIGQGLGEDLQSDSLKLRDAARSALRNRMAATFLPAGAATAVTLLLLILRAS